VYQSPVRSATAGRGTTLLAIVAMLSLLLSAFAIARPAVASHGGEHLNPDHRGTSWDNEAQNANCPPGDLDRIEEGEVLWHFILTSPESDSATLTAHFDTDGDGIADLTKTQESEEPDGEGALHFYVVTGPATLIDAETDVAGGNLNLSHICNEVVLEGSILVHKVDADTEALVGGATFELADGTPLTEDPAGVHCVDGLPFGWYDVHEITPPPNYHGDPAGSKPFEVDSISTCDDRVGDAPDLVFFNEEMLGSVLVHKTDAETDDLVGGAVFTIKAADAPAEDAGASLTEYDDGAHCIDGLSFDDYVVTESQEPPGYLPATPDHQDVTVSSESTCDEARLAGAPDLVFENEEVAPTGSVTINKQLEECEVCEAFTPGYWFNRGGGGGVDWADDWLMTNPQVIDGISDADGFGSVGEVQEYLDWDRSGGDGANGLSATGQLLRHYLALVLNVAFAEANECDLASLTHGDGTVADWLDAALTALETNASDAEKGDIKDALDAINNSDAGDGTLECDETSGGPHAGVTFELYDSTDTLVDSGTTDEDGSLVLDGNPDGSGLPLGTYTLVETGNTAELECTIISVEGEGATLEADGTVTIVLTDETPDVTITVVDDCEEEQVDEDEFGHISVIKATDEEEPSESFAFEATWDADGFDLVDGGLEPSGDLLAGLDYEVTETLTAEQIAAGWSLVDIECTGAATWSVSEDGTTVTISLAADEDVECTFTNELDEDVEEDEEILEVEKIICAAAVTDTTFEGPFYIPIQTLQTQGEDALDEGCRLGDATFTVWTDPDMDGVGDELATSPDLTDGMFSTGSDGVAHVDLAPGWYVLDEPATELFEGGTIRFEIREGTLTRIVVRNDVGEETAFVKVIKYFCDTESPEDFEDPWLVIEDDADAEDVTAELPSNFDDCSLGGTNGNPEAQFSLNGSTFWTGVGAGDEDSGQAVVQVALDTYVLSEVDPMEVTGPTLVLDEDGEVVTVFWFNFEDEGVAPEEEEEEEEQREGTRGSQAGPGQGTLPNTATLPDPTGSVPAALLALAMLTGLGAAGYAMQAEARRRR